MTKSELRGQMKKRLTRLSPRQVEQKSDRIYERVISLSCFRQAELVLAYISINGEVGTQGMIRSARDAGKRVFAPRIAENELVFHLLPKYGTRLQHNRFGIPEPPAALPGFVMEEAMHGAILVITPGLAFDRKKNRLGRGMGYYDRFLGHMRNHTAEHCIIVGVCFTEQVVDVLPVTKNDVAVDMLITDGEIIH